MKGLYRGRYLIAVYDKNDMLIGVADNAKELAKWYKNEHVAASCMNHAIEKDIVDNRLFFIDIFESHTDCFRLEDKKFLDFILKEYGKLDDEKKF